MSRLDRFLRLEKKRPAASGTAPALGSPKRFGAEPTPEERPLRVLEHEGMPFVRCCVCRTDHHLTATVCQNCEGDLTTPVQRAFNQALARDYAQRSAEERADGDRVSASRAEADQAARDAQRLAYTTLEQMAAQRAESEPPIGLRLARRIPNPVVRLVVLVLAAVLPLALIFGSGVGSAGFEVGLVLLFLVAAAFAPRRVRRMIWED